MTDDRLEDLYLENGEKATQDDVMRWWMYHYPRNVFVTGPLPVIHHAMEDLLERRYTY